MRRIIAAMMVAVMVVIGAACSTSTRPATFTVADKARTGRCGCQETLYGTLTEEDGSTEVTEYYVDLEEYLEAEVGTTYQVTLSHTTGDTYDSIDLGAPVPG